MPAWSFADAIISRVHIKNGGFDLNLTQFDVDDAVAMDDFIYGEPVAVPEPGKCLLALGVLVLMASPVRRG